MVLLLIVVVAAVMDACLALLCGERDDANWLHVEQRLWYLSWVIQPVSYCAYTRTQKKARKSETELDGVQAFQTLADPRQQLDEPPRT